MNTFRINTTAYNEEDFFITSNLTEKEIIDVIKPLVIAERNGNDEYDNEDLCRALITAYPNKKIEINYSFEKISI